MLGTEARERLFTEPLVGERSVVGRSRSGSDGGRGGSENAGISSEKTGENPVRRKPKGS